MEMPAVPTYVAGSKALLWPQPLVSGMLLSSDAARSPGVAAMPRYIAPLATTPPAAQSGPYQPGEVLLRSAALLGQTSPVPRLAEGAVPPVKDTADEVHSNCSTTDTEEAWRGRPRRAPSPVDPAAAEDTHSLITGSSASGTPATTCSVELFHRESLAEDAALGSPELPTVGSSSHWSGRCKPCAFVFKDGCTSGTECRFCHLCGAGEKKRRKKVSKVLRKAVKQA